MTALAAVRAIHYVAMAQMFGAALFATFVGKPVLTSGAVADRLQSRLATLQGWSTAAALLSWIAWFVLQGAAMTDGSVGGLGGSALVTVLQATTFGHVWVLRFAILVVAAILVIGQRAPVATERGSLRDAFATLAGVAALAILAGIGHSAADSGSDKIIHMSADAVHALAAGAWLGMLLPLAAVLCSGADILAVNAVVTRFSAIGIVAVTLLLLSGVVNSVYLVGSWPALFGTPYGELLLLKLGLFAVMIVLALANRLRSTPQLLRIGVASSRAAARVARNARLEAALGVAVFTVVGVLGTWIPAAHDDVWWRFPFRLETEEHHLPSVVPAHPTTYLRSPNRYTATSIVRGSMVYAANCQACHGPDGHGNGRAAAELTVKPADLAAEHVLGHTDGDLYWWITHGIGGTPMPAFEATLDERSRWDVVEFVKTVAAAAAMRTSTPMAEIQAPEFTYQIGYGPQQTVPSTTEGAATLLVLYTLPRSSERLAELAANAADLGRVGIRVVAVPIGGEAAADPLVVPIIATASEDVAKAYALFDRTTARREHLEALIDRDGLLRPVWHLANAPGVLELLDHTARFVDSQHRPRPMPHMHHR